jgi:predicted SnoaL-like aldol condensation-catalyzing enzyme
MAKEGENNGYKVIVECCALAASDSWAYVWIDTWCIDKVSSAELWEAINSKFE